MLRNYLKIAIRNITTQKTYSFINIAGLAFGMACFILILLYVRYELSYESHHIKADSVYRVNVIQQHPNGEYKTQSSMVPLGPALKNEIPAIIDYARFENAGKSLVTYKDKKFYEKNMVFTDQGLFNLFTIPVIAGKMESALTNKFSVVITQSMAKKYFGNQSPIGKTLEIDDELSLLVTAVIEDFPKNTHINPDFMISFNTLKDLTDDSFMTNWVTVRLQTYLLLQDNQSIHELEQTLNHVMNSHSSTEVERGLELEQFSRIHLYSEVTSWSDIRKIYLFVAIGILILIIASINFMNLSTARSTKRSKEVGLRKVVGANHGQLIKQFLGESIVTSIIALILAIVIVINIVPLFRNITEQDLIFPALTDWNFYGLLLVITLIVGFLSGSYPALYLSAFSPINVLRGKKSLSGKNTNIRKFLVVAQFSIAIGLIITTLSINHQIDYLQNKSLGFQKDQIVILPVMGDNFRKDTEPFKQELLKNANISAVCGSLLLPSRIGMFNNVTWEGAAENESIALIQNKVDYDFLDLYEIPIAEGRNFSREHSLDILDYSRENVIGAVILNKEAVKKFGWKDPINKKVIQTYGTQRWSLNVIGVIEDFHFSSLHNKIRPLSLFLRPADPWKFSVKINTANIPNTIDYIRKTWTKFNPNFPFEYYFLDETFNQTYKSEEKLQTLFSYFSLLSVIISCLGLFGLAAFAAEQKTKEIGVRKVLGASVSNILMLLSKEFTKWIIVANIIAWPAAWYYLNSWLKEFAYSAEIAWPIFFIAGGTAIIIALLTISIQTLKAALSNPIKSLRYE